VPPKPAPSLPLPPRPAPPPPPAPPTVTSRPNPASNAAADSRALLATLERLRAQEARRGAASTRQAAARPGSSSGSDNAKLSTSDARRIGDKLRECWALDPGDHADLPQSVRITVTTDGDGVVRDARVSSADISGTGSGRARYFAEQAMRAARSPQCSPLPLPPPMLGAVHTFEITFRP
jgi:hypothetical protein